LKTLQNKGSLWVSLASKILPAGSSLRRLGLQIINSRYARKFYLKEMVWDPWILSDGKRHYLFYLIDDTMDYPDNCYWYNCDIALAVSNDLRNWESMGKVLSTDPEIPWESQRLCAGSAIQDNDTLYLFYSSAGKENILEEHICLASSANGLEWNRYENNPLLKIEPDNPWYGHSSRDGHLHLQCRDPHIMKHEEDGKYYIFFSASLKSSSVKEHLGCVGAAVANEVAGPYEFLPPVTGLAPGREETYGYEMERPQVVFLGGQYHLFWSTFQPNSHIDFIASNKTISRTYHFISDNFLGPYQPHGSDPILRNPDGNALYGINLYPLPGREDAFFLYGWDRITRKLMVNPDYVFK
jgi:hypothetical protein